MPAIVTYGETPLKAPFKWAGGKSKQIVKIREHFPKNAPVQYVEPFLGAGTVLLDRLQAWDRMGVQFIAGDLNDALINFWVCLRLSPAALIKELLELKKIERGEKTKYQYYNSKTASKFKSAYNSLRTEFNKISSTREHLPLILYPHGLTRETNIPFAATFYCLIKTSFRGSWRINRANMLTSTPGLPIPFLVDHQLLDRISTMLHNNKVQFYLMDFFETAKMCVRGSVCYIDPPYDLATVAYVAPIEALAAKQFQEDVARTCEELADRGVNTFISNADTENIRTYFKNWENIEIEVKARMSNTSNAQNDELLIFNRSKSKSSDSATMMRPIFNTLLLPPPQAVPYPLSRASMSIGGPMYVTRASSKVMLPIKSRLRNHQLLFHP